MQYINRFLVYSGVLAMVFSCADLDPLEFAVEKPKAIQAQEELNEYEPLKSYIDSSSNPKFKLGGAVSLSDYVNKGLAYRLINKNFHELTLGYGMKHGAVVQADGTIELRQVNELIAAAEAVGTSVFGHTLTWHANQNASYLNGTLAPLVIESPSFPNDLDKAGLEDGSLSGYTTNSQGLSIVDGQGIGEGANAIEIQVASANEDPGAVRLTTPDIPVVAGHEYEVIFYIKSDQPGQGRISFEGLNENTPALDYDSDGEATEFFQTGFSWNEVRFKVKDFAGDSFSLNFDFGYSAGVTYTIDVNNLYVYDTQGDLIVSNLVENGDFETGTGWGGWGNNAQMGVTQDGLGYGNQGKAFFLTNPSITGGFWEVQSVYEFPEALTNGEMYTLSFWVKGDAEGIIRPELQSPDYSSNAFGQVNVNQEWQRVELSTTATAADRQRLIVSYGEFAGTVYIDNVSLTSASGGGGSTTILIRDDEVKKAIVEQELERWIETMVTGLPYVNAWDVVNEPMDDGNPYELKSAQTDSDISSDEFYWQDYLGKDYAVKAFNLAREFGKPEDLLFINDYNLEYNLDKCKGLIDYVSYIESQGATVDGIGTQMHISIDSDKDKITEMFKLLAQTGKLVKVSELDVRTNTSEATEEILQLQAEMYAYVVQAYIDNVPKEQRYGITVWGISDSPEDASWLPGEFQGLWDINLNRKPAYQSFAEALKGL